MAELELIKCGLSVDDRGLLVFANVIDFTDIKRFFQVENHRAGFVRAWYGHPREVRFIYVVKGAALIGVVPRKTEELPTSSKDLSSAKKFTLSSRCPAFLCIPSDYLYGFKTLVKDTVVLFFSTISLEESQEETIRYHWDTWNVWN